MTSSFNNLFLPDTNITSLSYKNSLPLQVCPLCNIDVTNYIFMYLVAINTDS